MKKQVLALLTLFVLTPTAVLAARPSISSLQQQINQLNARLNAVEAELATKKTLYLNANGSNVGVVIDGEGGSPLKTTTYEVLSDTGYLFAVRSSTGDLDFSVANNNYYYLDSTCSGNPYLLVELNPNPGDPVPVDHQGRVIPRGAANDINPAYYVAKGTVAASLTMGSRLIIGGGVGQNQCDALPKTDGLFFPLVPNDPAVTGVPQPPLATPIILGF